MTCQFCNHEPCLNTEDCPGGRHHERIKARGLDVESLCTPRAKCRHEGYSHDTNLPCGSVEAPVPQLVVNNTLWDRRTKLRPTTQLSGPLLIMLHNLVQKGTWT